MMKLFLEVFATPRGVKARKGVREEVARSNASPATRENLMGRMQTALGQTARRMTASDMVSANRATGRTNANPASQVRNTAGRTVPSSGNTARPLPTPRTNQTRAQAIQAAARSRAPIGDLTAEAQRARRTNTANRRTASGSTSRR